jgi:hypothetical protein
MFTALTIVIGSWVGFAAKLFLSKSLPVIGGIAMLVIDLISFAFATCLLFRRLQLRYTRVEAKGAAIAFVLLSPIMIVMARFFSNELLPYLSIGLRLPGRLVFAGASMGGIVFAVGVFFVFCGTALGWTRLLSRAP